MQRKAGFKSCNIAMIKQLDEKDGILCLSECSWRKDFFLNLSVYTWWLTRRRQRRDGLNRFSIDFAPVCLVAKKNIRSVLQEREMLIQEGYNSHFFLEKCKKLRPYLWRKAFVGLPLKSYVFIRRNVPYTNQKHWFDHLIYTSSPNEICCTSKKTDVSCICIRMFTDVC